MSPRLKQQLLLCLVALSIGGCSSEEIYHPRGTPTAVKVNPPSTGDRQTSIVHKIEDVDYSSYAIPMYPESKAIGGSETATDKGKQVAVTLESLDQVAPITNWYRDQLQSQTGYLVQEDLGALEGKTNAGYAVKISIAKIDLKSTIVITLDTNKDK